MTDDAAPAGNRDPARSTLWAVLRGLGTSDEEIARAERDGTLTLLTVERMMVPEPGRYDLDEVTRRTGLSPDLLTRLWRSLGYPEPRPGDKAFNDADVEILARVGELVEHDPDREPLVLQVSRVLGSSMARIAAAEVDVIRGPSAPPGDTDALVDEEVVSGAGALLSMMPRILEQAWRRHLQAAVRRRMVAVAGNDRADVVVGFADLVGFTALSQQVSEVELSGIVGEFEALAFDVITAGGGRVVKTIGDEVMFTVASPKAAAEIALSLSEGTRASDELGDVRVGMASGPVLDREGDLFGPVVNLASRITAIALPGSVVIGPELAAALEDDPDYVVKPMRPRYLKHIGRVHLRVLRRADPEAGPSRFADRRQALRDAVRARY
ncbi:MAG TPA: adenylate/guanylate cyclase domain-containing protein [Acidimicrobiales bacterium]